MEGTVRYILKRLLLAVGTIWVVITATFFLMRAVPGGPFLGEKALSPEAQAALEAKYGLDRPLFEQYATYLGDVVTKLDFGPSLKSPGQTVRRIITRGLQVSVPLGLWAAAIAAVTGILLGSAAALQRGKWADKVIMGLSTAFVSLPSFILGTVLLLLFTLRFPLLPANGTMAGGRILPIITLSLYPAAYITRLTRSSMAEVLGQDYIRTARAKGVSPGGILFRHALKNALGPVITYMGPMVAGIVTGSLVVERIFAVPGIGRTFVGSISDRDYPLIMGTTIVLAVLIIVMNLLADIFYSLADPRIELR